jgi:hypothetical protein
MRIAAFIAVLSMAAAALLPGCNIATPIAYVIMGPPTIPPEIELPDVPTVVFIDDRQNVVNPVSLRRVIADRVSQQLMVKKVLTTTISSADAMALASVNDKASKVMSLEDIGLAVGAKQVIAVEMLMFTESPDGGATLIPTAACRVKVLDLETRKRLYPPAEAEVASRYLEVRLPPIDPVLLRSRAGRLQIFNDLAGETGLSIAELFYEHEKRMPGGGIGPKPST